MVKLRNNPAIALVNYLSFATLISIFVSDALSGEHVKNEQVDGNRSPERFGRVELDVSGAFTRQARGIGPECHHWNTANAVMYVASQAIEGPDSRPEWLLSIGPFGPESALQVNFILGVNTRYSWTKTDINEKPPFVKYSDRVEIDAILMSEDGSASVKVRGTVWCPIERSAVAVPQDIRAILESVARTPSRDYSTFDFGREKDHSCVSVVVPKNESRAIVRRLRSQLLPGWIAFIGTSRWLGDERHDGVEIVVGPGDSQLEILRAARSNAANYNMNTEALVKKLRVYDQRYGIDIFHAESDTIEFTMLRMPEDVMAVARDLYEFCPDIVDQGLGSIQRLRDELDRTHMVYLWWD
jgi:uncharacterized protein DUF4253